MGILYLLILGWLHLVKEMRAGLLVLGCLLVACTPSTNGPGSTESSTKPTSISEADRVAMEAACMRDRGVEARSEGIALIYDEGLESQAAAVDGILAECIDLVDERYPRPPAEDFSSQEARAALYEKQLAAWECLSREGYRIESPPSLDVWLDSWDTGPWDPYMIVVEMVETEQEWTRINDSCPQPANTVFRLWEPIVVDP